MKTIIVPIDFSEVSVNAAKYAAGLSAEYQEARIILFHSTIGKDLSEGISEDTALNMATNSMEVLSHELQTINAAATFITEVNDMPVFESIEQLYSKYDATLIVMGITGKTKLEQKLIGSNTLKTAQQSGKPVLIIPADTLYQPVEKISVAVQFKEGLLEKMPANTIISFANELAAQLLVLNVATENDETPGSYIFAGQQASHIMFDKANATYHLVEDNDVVNAITNFAQQEQVQIVVSIAEQHSFIESLFKGSVTKKLAFYMHLPLLVLTARK